ncbi:hypothetical protein Tco_0928156 [Tanacetum coccineum]
MSMCLSPLNCLNDDSSILNCCLVPRIRQEGLIEGTTSLESNSVEDGCGIAVPYKNVMVQDIGSIVVKQRIAVDNTDSGSNKMENWQLTQSDPDTFVLLNELHWHELHVALDVHTSDQSIEVNMSKSSCNLDSRSCNDSSEP